MAEKLSITIGLEGGKELQRQLADIGKAGQQAFLEIEKAAQAAGGFTKLAPAQVAQFTAKLKEMGIVGQDAFNKISGAVASATRTERLVQSISAVENGFAGLANVAAMFGLTLGRLNAAGAIGAIVKVAADAASAIQKTDAEALKLRMTFSQFDKLKQSFEKAGLSAGAVADGITKAAAAIEKLDVERVARLQKAMEGKGQDESDFTRSLATLKKMAEGVGPGADAAREALQKLANAGVGGLGLDKLTTQLSPLEEMFKRLGFAIGGVAPTVEQVKAALERLPDSAQRTADALKLLGEKAGPEFIQGLKLKEGTLDPAVAAAVKLEQQWNRTWASWERLKTSVGAGFDVAMLDTFASDVRTATAVVDTLSAAMERLISIFKGAPAALRGIGAGGGEPGSVTPAPGNARGGYIRGPGSATSDSILARLSNGEFVLSARATRHWGVDFLRALNSLQTPQFSMGGLAPAMPRFASGGLVNAGAATPAGRDFGHLTLQLAGGGKASGLVEREVFELLRKGAVKRNIGTDRKPGWVK